MNGEIHVKYTETFDIIYVCLDGTSVSSSRFNGCKFLINELGLIVGYYVNGHSERPFLSRLFLKFLGRPFAEMEEVYGLA